MPQVYLLAFSTGILFDGPRSNHCSIYFNHLLPTISFPIGAPWQEVLNALMSNTEERSDTVTLVFEREIEVPDVPDVEEAPVVEAPAK